MVDPNLLSQLATTLTHSRLMCSFNRHLLSTYWVLGTSMVLGTRDTDVNKTDKHFYQGLVGETDKKHDR